MCKRNHPIERQWIDSQGKRCCRECHRLNVRRLRLRKAKGLPSIERYVLNTELFKRSVPHGMKYRLFELAGISRDCIGHYYQGTALNDASRRELLAIEAHIPVNQLWVKRNILAE